MNLFVGVLNLVPGLPLDGGRVLKAIVGATGNVHRGTNADGWGGRLAAVAVLGWPLLMEPLWGTGLDLIDFVLAFVVATFLWSGATAAMASARLRRRLPQLVARDLARRTSPSPTTCRSPRPSVVPRRRRRQHRDGDSAAGTCSAW